MLAVNENHTPLATSVVSPILLNFPPSFGADILSVLIGLSVAAIHTYRSRARHKIPPACSPPGTRNPIWLLTDVLAWLASHREPVAVPPAPKPSKPSAAVSTRRRPTKVEQAAAQAAGFNGVKAHRSAMKGCAL